MHISNTNEYFFPILYTCINFNPPMNPVKCCPDQIQNGRLIAILFAQIDIIFENFVRPDAYLQHQWIFVSNTLHMHGPQSSHESCEVTSGSNSKWPTYCHFVCSNWQNIWKFCPSGCISPTPMNICFQHFTHAWTPILPWILWSFIWIKLKMVDLMPFLFAQIDKILENFVRPDEYPQHQWIFVSDTLHMH